MKFVLLVLLAAGPAVCASDAFRAEMNVVLVNVTVLDRQERPVRGIDRARFRVFDERAEQSIAYFTEDEVPLSLAVVFDESGSVAPKIADMRAAVSAVLGNANVSDEFALVTFAGAPRLAAGWNTDADAVASALLADSVRGETSLLDAVGIALRYLKTAHNPRKALVIFSDGGDNHSRLTEREVARELAESDVQIYAINTAERDALRAKSPEEFGGPGLLARLCDGAGGRYFDVDGRRALATAAEEISRELRSQYVIGYVPTFGTQDGRFHHLRVDVAGAKLSVFSRRGYRVTSD